MLHPRHLLQDLVDGELTDRRRMAVERHVVRCSSCSDAVSRLRGLKSALLGLQSPSPDPDLRSRLLAPDFAEARRGPGHAGLNVAPPSSRRRAGTHPDPSAPGRQRRRRTLLASAGGSAVVATALLASAYVVGSETPPLPAEAAAGTTSLRAGWESVAPSTPTVLDTGQLDTLRAGGWYCPELETLGFTLRSAEGITVAGRPTLELVLENDGETVTVYEQRKVGGGAEVDGAPLTAVTGESVVSSGFEHIGGSGRDVWVRSGEPWQVVLDSPSVTYTVVSTMPAAAMPDTLSQLVTTEHAQLTVAPRAGDDSMLKRIVRGLSMITQADTSR